MKIKLKSTLPILFLTRCLQHKDLHIFHHTNENGMNQKNSVGINLSNHFLFFIFLKVKFLLIALGFKTKKII